MKRSADFTIGIPSIQAGEDVVDAFVLDEVRAVRVREEVEAFTSPDLPPVGLLEALAKPSLLLFDLRQNGLFAADLRF